MTDLQIDGFAREAETDALEAERKRHSLVIVNLKEDTDTKEFVDDACCKLSITPGSFAEFFRDGPTASEG